MHPGMLDMQARIEIMKENIIGKNDAGQRLDRFLALFGHQKFAKFAPRGREIAPKVAPWKGQKNLGFLPLQCWTKQSF